MIPATKKYITGLFFLFFFSSEAFAQYDSIVNQMQKEFDSFKKGIEQEHQQFKSKNDSVFSVFLKESWESFDVFFKPKPEEKPKPAIQPSIPDIPNPKTSPEQTIPRDTMKTGTVSEPIQIDIGTLEQVPEPEYERMGAVPVPIEFYGTTPSLYVPEGLPHLRQITGKDIARFFDESANSIQLSQLQLQLNEIKKNLQLNDWGFLLLIQSAAAKIYELPAEQALLSWVLLLKGGLNAKVGYSDHEILLMIPSRHEIYNSWYLVVNNTTFYILTNEKGNRSFPELTVHKADYPGNSPISLKLTHLPNLGNQSISKELKFRDKSFSVATDVNLINFYRDYPLCELEVFFSAPMTTSATNSLESFFNPLLKGMTPEQKVAILLEFTQKSFAYKTDKEHFGREKFLFPDELFFHPYSDCEDRSVLFTRLVRHFTGLTCAGLEYPGHVNTAVLFSGETTGTRIKINDQSFTVCDPTYRNAPVGYLAAEYQDIKPGIIIFE